MTNDKAVKANLLEALAETMERARCLVDGIEAMDRINDYDLMDQTYSMNETIKKMNAIIDRATAINGH